MIALDAATGRLLWRTLVGVHYVDSYFDVRTGHASGFVALDVTTGNPRWRVDYGVPDVGDGVLALGGAVVANDLVFTSTSDGTVYAYDKTDGEEVWRYVAPAGVNAPLAIAGDTLYVPAGAGIGTPPALIALRLR